MEAAEAKNRVESLRAEIGRLQAAPRRYLSGLRTGISDFDRLFSSGGLPLGQALELWGEAASGRTSLALRALAAATRENRLGAFVDGPGELYPPAAVTFGVNLSRLLIVRPKPPGKLVWTAVQLARSGAFSCVVLDLTHTGVRLSLAEGKKLLDAAFRGGSCLLLLTPSDAPGEGMSRLQISTHGLGGIRVEVLRSRQGAAGAQILIPWSALSRESVLPTQSQSGEDPFAVCNQSEARVPSVRREKTSWLRDGHGIARSRPGRDVALPLLGSSLGCEA
jgi:hypothetical protein